jgi:hypothetical protein
MTPGVNTLAHHLNQSGRYDQALPVLDATPARETVAMQPRLRLADACEHEPRDLTNGSRTWALRARKTNPNSCRRFRDQIEVRTSKF